MVEEVVVVVRVLGRDMFKCDGDRRQGLFVSRVKASLSDALARWLPYGYYHRRWPEATYPLYLVTDGLLQKQYSKYSAPTIHRPPATSLGLAPHFCPPSPCIILSLLIHFATSALPPSLRGLTHTCPPSEKGKAWFHLTSLLVEGIIVMVNKLQFSFC